MSDGASYRSRQDWQLSAHASVSGTGENSTAKSPEQTGHVSTAISSGAIAAGLQMDPVLTSPQLEERQREQPLRITEATALAGNKTGDELAIEQRGIGLAQDLFDISSPWTAE